MALQKRKLYERLKERDGLTCGICKQSLEGEWALYEEWLVWANLKEGTKPKAPFKRAKLGLTIDHIYPKSLGRNNGWPKERIWALTNLQLAHLSCNTKKGNYYAEAEDGTEGMAFLSEVQPVLLVHEVPSDVLPAREESGLVSQVRSGVGEGAGETKKEILKRAMLAYNEGAKMWNSLPGPRLIWPKDKFAIKYCYCPGPDSKKKLVTGLVVAGKPFKCCFTCGFPLKGEWDD